MAAASSALATKLAISERRATALSRRLAASTDALAQTREENDQLRREIAALRGRVGKRQRESPPPGGGDNRRGSSAKSRARGGGAALPPRVAARGVAAASGSLAAAYPGVTSPTQEHAPAGGQPSSRDAVRAWKAMGRNRVAAEKRSKMSTGTSTQLALDGFLAPFVFPT